MRAGAGRAGLACGAALLAAAPAFAQPPQPPQPDVGGDPTAPSQGQARALVVQPRISVQETLSDNVNLAPTNKQGGLITTISPGLHLSSQSGHVTGTLDYSFNGIFYTGVSRSAQIQNQLAANGRAELVDNILFVDATAGISHQTLSSLGTLSGSSVVGTNQQEVGSASVSPYVRGRLGDIARVELRDTANIVETRGSSAGTTTGNSIGNAVSARLDGLTGGALNWWASGTSQTTRFRSAGFAARSDELLLGLQWRVDVDFLASLFGGRERSNYLLGPEADSKTYGATAQWTPNPRTRAEFDWQHHVYGDAHTLRLDYRLARSALRVSDVNAVNLGQPQASGATTTNYDLLYLEFASIEPDPTRRDALVRAYLQALGVDPNGQVVAAFETLGPTLQRNQQFALSLDGLRTTWIVTVSQGRTRTLGNGALPIAGATTAAFGALRSRGASLTASNKLTPTMSANLSIAIQHNNGTPLGTISAPTTTGLRSITAGWSDHLGPQTTLTLSARSSQGSGAGTYTEHALVAGLVQTF